MPGQRTKLYLRKLDTITTSITFCDNVSCEHKHTSCQNYLIRALAVCARQVTLSTISCCRGVTDVGTGLQAVAAAITDPDTISAYQDETSNGKLSHRTFYGGMHELSGGVNHAGDSIQDLAKVCSYLIGA